MADVTVAFVPRETVSRTVDSLNSILLHTTTPHELLIVIACYPEALRAELRKIALDRGATIVELPGFVTPNEARNAALAQVTTPYIAFIDNDAEVRGDWLGPLLDCARTHDATIVAPLVFELYPPFTRIHMAGGEARLVRPRNGTFSMSEYHYHAHETIGADLSFGEAFETELVEFHAVLVKMDWLRSAGGLDPELCSMAEHWDMCVQARMAHKKIMLEPASEVNYSPPRKVTTDDLRFYNLRWSREWFVRGARRLREKYRMRHGAAFRQWRWVVDHRTHGNVELVRSHMPSLSYGAARTLTARLVIPWSEAFPSAQFRADLAEWRRNRGAS
jgi:GT2 family glycosyltransferase